MMNIRVDIVSRETIKPSSPTPHHLKNFNPCLLDELAPPTYFSLILFYPKSSHNYNFGHETSTRLKKSLSETLTRFFPLAGRIKGSFHIDCNDEGATYLEARVNCRLSEVFEQTKRKLHNHLLPCTPFAVLQDITTAPLAQVVVQVNVFDCGSVAISICMLHKLADASVLSSFLKCWASIARSAYEEVANVPDVNVASFLFPIPIGFMPGGGQLYNPWIGQGKKVGIRFVFDGKAITTLKEKAKSEGVPNPTRIEAISGFIWKCAMSAFTATSGSLKPSILLHAVNIRGRMEPPLPSYAFGNLFRLAVSLYGFDNKSVDLELPSLVGLISHAIKQLNSDSLKKIQGDEGYVEITRNMNLLKEVIHKQNPLIFIFTSWCHMGFNEIDFGWGQPFWVGISGEEIDQAYANAVVLKETKCGDGIEAWINLNEQEMAVLENDLEFLAFASSDPHIF